MSLNGKRVVIFDADHTLYLVNTKRAYQNMFSMLSRELGVPALEIEQEFRNILSKILETPELYNDPEKRKREYTIERVMEVLRADMPAQKKRELVEKSVKKFFDIVSQDLEPWPGLEDLLRDLSKKYVLYVSTEEFSPWIEQKLSRAIPGWEGFFRGVITPDETGTMKPAREYCTLILEREKASPQEAVMVGDDWRRDLEPAKRLGVATILVSEAREGEPDYHVKTLPEIHPILL